MFSRRCAIQIDVYLTLPYLTLPSHSAFLIHLITTSFSFPLHLFSFSVHFNCWCLRRANDMFRADAVSIFFIRSMRSTPSSVCTAALQDVVRSRQSSIPLWPALVHLYLYICHSVSCTHFTGKIINRIKTILIDYLLPITSVIITIVGFYPRLTYSYLFKLKMAVVRLLEIAVLSY